MTLRLLSPLANVAICAMSFTYVTNRVVWPEADQLVLVKKRSEGRWKALPTGLQFVHLAPFNKGEWKLIDCSEQAASADIDPWPDTPSFQVHAFVVRRVDRARVLDIVDDRTLTDAEVDAYVNRCHYIVSRYDILRDLERTIGAFTPTRWFHRSLFMNFSVAPNEIRQHFERRVSGVEDKFGAHTLPVIFVRSGVELRLSRERQHEKEKAHEAANEN